MSQPDLFIDGTVIHVGEPQDFGKFRKRDIVIRTAGKYQQEIPMQCAMRNIDLLTADNLGDTIRADFNLRGRHSEKSGKWFAALDVWRIEVLAQGKLLPDDTPVDEETDEKLPF